MSDPRRFREGGGGELERLVVDSWRDEAPSASARRRVEIALGVAAGVTATTTTVGALGASKAAQTGVAIGLTKWIGIAAVTAVVGGGAATYVISKSKESSGPPAVASVTVEAKPAQATPPPPFLAPLPVASAPVEPPSASAPPSATAPTATALAAPSKPTPTLGDELHLLDEARAALDGGDTGRALALLNRHDTDFRGGSLAPEAMALRVEVYARSGDRDSAAHLGTRFLALYGNRPQAQRVRSIVEAVQSETIEPAKRGEPGSDPSNP